MVSHRMEGAFPKCELIPQRAVWPRRTMGLSSKTVVSNWSTLDRASSRSPHVSENTARFPSPWAAGQSGIPHNCGAVTSPPGLSVWPPLRQPLFQEGLDYPEAALREMEKTGVNRNHHPGCQGKAASHQSKDPGGMRKILSAQVPE